MGKSSLIYRHIVIYRMLMNILYLGKYKSRFSSVIEKIKNLPVGSTVLELCFGDIYIAEYCKKKQYNWIGLDLNEVFVKEAQKLGYNAYREDLTHAEHLPKSGVCIMMGSLYHFHKELGSLLSKMFEASDTVIISEPVSNLSSLKGIIGFFAKRSADAGKGYETFRYDTASLMDALTRHCALFGTRIVLSERHGKDLIVKLTRK